MADFDEIVIKNVGKDGVASEVTLQRLVSALEKSKGIDDKSKRNLEGLAKASKKTKDSFASFSDEIEKTTTIMEDVGNTLKKAFTLESFGKVLGFAAGTATNFGKEIAKGSVEIGDFAQHIPVIGSSLGMLTSFFQDGLDTFRNLSDVGAGFGNNLVELRRQAAASGLSLDQFSSMVTNNADRMRLLGGTTSQGAAQFAQLSKQLRVGGFGDKLMNMGYTMDELNEGLGDYISLQSRNGTLQSMTQQQLVEGSQNYLTEIDRLARVTGQSRKAIAEEMQKNMQKANLQALMANMTREQALEFNAGLAAARKVLPGFGDALEDLADGVAQTPLGKKLAALSPAVADAAAAFGRGEITSDQFMSSLKNVGGPALLDFVNGLDASQRSALLQQEGFSELLGSVHEMRDFVNSNFDPKAAAKEQERRNKVNEGLATFQQRIEDVRQKLVDAFITSGLADTLGSALVSFADLFLGMANAISDFVKDISDGNIITAIMGLFTDAIGGLWNNKGLIAAMIAGIAGLFAAKAVVGALAGAASKAIGNKVKGALGLSLGDDSAGGGKRGDNGKGLAAKAGNAGKGIGSFIGNMGAGIMKGAAAGLSAFANPKILIGAGILAGTIVVIGGAIAGASWLLGKSLPTLVEGIKSFEQLDGGALSAVAKGLVDLSLALAAFGAGSAVAGLGTMIGGITEGIGKLFGAEDPIDKLVRFSKADIDAAKVKNNAEALVAFSDAMAATAGGSVVTGLGAMIGGIAEGIGSIFGGEDLLTKLERFASYDIDTAKVKNNAEALVTFSNAMAIAGAGNAAGGLGAIVSNVIDGVLGFFGADKDPIPFDEIIKFSQHNIDVAGVKSTADAVTAFATALQAMASVQVTGEISIRALNKATTAAKWVLSEMIPQVMTAYMEGMNNGGMNMTGSGKVIENVVIPFIDSLKLLQDKAATLGGEEGAFSKIFGGGGSNEQLSKLLEMAPKFGTLAEGMSAIGAVEGFESKIDVLKELNPDNINSYAEAMEKLVDVLGDLNDVLAEDNKGMFGGGTGVSAANVVRAPALGGGSGLSAEKLDQLNTTMQLIMTILDESRGYHKDTVKAVRSGDLQRGV